MLGVTIGAVLIGVALHLAQRGGLDVILIVAKWGFPAGAALVAGLVLYLHAMSQGRVLRWIFLPAVIVSLIASAGLSVYDAGMADAERAAAGEIADLKAKLRNATAPKPPEKPVEAAALAPLLPQPQVSETPPAPAAVAPRPIRHPKAKSAPKAAEAGTTLETMKWPF